MKTIPASLLTLTAGILVTLVSLWIGQHHGLLPEQASLQAPLVDGFFNVMVTIGTALFLVVEGTILLFAIKYRRRAGDDGDGIPVEGNVPLEAFWTAIPAIIVVGLGVYSVVVFQEMGGMSPGGLPIAHHHPTAVVAQAPHSTMTSDAVADIALSPDGIQYGIGAPTAEANHPADVTVNVTAMQYAWLFNYPGENITAGELHVPVGKDVQLTLAAQDVIHSFWVPQFRIKQDVIPGEKTEYRFVATKVGSFPIVCTELCGSYHGGMRSTVVVHPQEEFDNWLESNRIAQADGIGAIATNTADFTTPEYLAPYGQEMGISTATLAQLHH